jgi:hypothetical protein
MTGKEIGAGRAVGGDLRSARGGSTYPGALLKTCRTRIIPSELATDNELVSNVHPISILLPSIALCFDSMPSISRRQLISIVRTKFDGDRA